VIDGMTQHPPPKATPAEIADALRRHGRFVLTTHINPDGDGLGSELALAHWLAATGKDVTILNHSATPAVYRFLDPGGLIRTYDEERDRHAVLEADAIIVLDTNHPERLRGLEPAVRASAALKIVVDHHLDPAPFADLYLLDDGATSTGEIVYRIALALWGPELPAETATALYCAIMTDTGSFRYPRVDAETFQICAHLLQCGADPVSIFSNVYERWSPGRMRLLGLTLDGLAVEAGGKLAHVAISRADLQRTGTTEEDTDNFTTYPMSIAGVVAGILFLELPGEVKISFRSRGAIPINELAKEFGGNGHANAAGARVTGLPLGEVRRRVVAAAVKYVRERPA
jgi:phosphoesterase RecJ-like protein